MALIYTNKPDKEQEYQKLKKRAESMDCMKFTMTIPTHIHKRFKKKLLNESKGMKEYLMEAILKYLERD
jgi:hypothetical protein